MEITLQPEDNIRLNNLCGVLDENIKQIESWIFNQFGHCQDQIMCDLFEFNIKLS